MCRSPNTFLDIYVGKKLYLTILVFLSCICFSAFGVYYSEFCVLYRFHVLYCFIIMVVFTCGHCGESVQKPKVEKHYMTKCRNRNPNLSCMDCFKDFFGNEYEVHTKCVTEEQRYSGKGFIAKEKKGEVKQNAWVEILQSVLDEQQGAPANVRRIIETISKHNNTPRKKPKFVNFVKNVCGHKTNPKDIDQAWDFISVKLADLSKVNQQNKKQCENEESDVKNRQNGDINPKNDDSLNENEISLNGTEPSLDQENSNLNHIDANKMSKKQMKEEKKRRKYEAELQKAGETLNEMDLEDTSTKKDKKKKNKEVAVVEESEEIIDNESKNKNKKRKRLDTQNSVQETNAAGPENITVAKEKKKLKTDAEDIDEGICLHDQNVAKSEDTMIRPDKFNWHAVIVSVLEKKGNEMPFKRLQKKVLSEYTEATGYEVDDRIAEKFIKKLKSAPKVKVDKNRVVLEE